MQLKFKVKKLIKHKNSYKMIFVKIKVFISEEL